METMFSFGYATIEPKVRPLSTEVLIEVDHPLKNAPPVRVANMKMLPAAARKMAADLIAAAAKIEAEAK